jgi:DNA helicase-2/ATP-dependent DNA helicase PcrA
VAEVLSLLREARDALEGTPLSEVARALISRSGLHGAYKTRDKADDTSKAANLEELVSAMASYGAGSEALSLFLENVALTNAPEEAGDEGADGKVTLVTLHNTKGLEFDRVIITGLEEGIFPHQSSTGTEEDLEEERRLFYVGITRARERLLITWCRRRRVFGRWTEQEPSRFLRELPAQGVRRIGEETGDEEDGYPLGCGVFHEEYGPGIVERKWYTTGTLLVQVRFRSGRVAKFVPRYTRLERISADE